MNCPKCGAEIAPGSAYCSACGAGVTDPGAPTVVLATVAEQDQLLVQLRKDLANEYEVDRELGRGGMAVVYRAREIELRRPVALKVLPPGTASPDMAERFRREARMAAALDHANIIPIYRVGQAAGTYYFAMKFVEGRAVDAILESQGALPVPVILQILLAAARALAFAHERQIIHRDIKGANILVDRDGRVLVSDFGIARAAEEKTITASGAVIGTPHFMSPEQCSGQKVGPQSDQYSLGVLAFQMLTGQVPFDADSVIAIIQHHYFTRVPDIGAVREEVPEELLAIVYRALAKDPAQRYASTREMVHALEAVPFRAEERAASEEMLRDLAVGTLIPRVRTGSLPPLADTRALGAAALAAATTSPAPATPGTATAPAPARRPPVKRRSRLPLVAGALVVVAAAAGGGYLALRGGGGGPAAPGDTSGAAVPSAARPGAPAAPTSMQGQDTSRGAAPGQLPATKGPTAIPRAAEPQASSAAPRPASPRAEQRTTAARPPQATAPALAPEQPDSGTLSVITYPPSAILYVDGRRFNVGGVAGASVPVGAHRLRISAPGCADSTVSFDVRVGVSTNLKTIRLNCEPGP